MRDALPHYDGIAFLLDNSFDEELQASKEELNSFLSDNSITQPIVVLVPTQNASGCANDPELISELELEDVIRNGKGRVSIFSYSLSPTQFIGCSEGELRASPLELMLTSMKIPLTIQPFVGSCTKYKCNFFKKKSRVVNVLYVNDAVMIVKR